MIPHSRARLTNIGAEIQAVSVAKFILDTQRPEALYWVAFGRVGGIGGVRLRRLYDHFGTLSDAWAAGAGELIAAGLDTRLVEKVVHLRQTLDLGREANRLEDHGIVALPIIDTAYPERLREVDGAPPVLYVKGNVTPQDETAVAVVGTRKATTYGRQVVEAIVGDLARQGVTIVSGLARGIDTAAHRTALDAGGRTIAVLAHGLDTVYPPDNRDLADHICNDDAGALVSDYPPGVTPDARNFPPRNRIISGLSYAVLVVEADIKSGALITTQFALDQGREVMAVPGGIFWPQSQGTNDLIRQGAKAVTCADDILTELNVNRLVAHVEAQEIVGDDDVERAILRALAETGTARHIDEVSLACGLPASAISATLTIMELKGKVRHNGSMNYSIGR